MRLRVFNRVAPMMGAAAALLAGCGGLQPPIGAPGAMPQSSTLARHTDGGQSWMLPGAKSQDLIYSSHPEGVAVYSYPADKLVGVTHLNKVQRVSRLARYDKPTK